MMNLNARKAQQNNCASSKNKECKLEATGYESVILISYRGFYKVQFCAQFCCVCMQIAEQMLLDVLPPHAQQIFFVAEGRKRFYFCYKVAQQNFLAARGGNMTNIRSTTCKWASDLQVTMVQA